jgi:hypothetical protein
MLATHDLGSALAAYRMSLALTLARQSGPFAAAADPVLAGFPPLLSDHHLLAEFLTRWKDLTNKMTAVVDADVSGGGAQGSEAVLRGTGVGLRDMAADGWRGCHDTRRAVQYGSSGVTCGERRCTWQTQDSTCADSVSYARSGMHSCSLSWRVLDVR